MTGINLTDESHQFDFWIGEWDCTWGDDQRATNTVTAILNGHVIHENFDGAPAMQFRGLSVSMYNPRRKCWQQTWVDDSGNYWAFNGGWADNRMTLVTDDVTAEGQMVMRRMIWYNISANAFEWNWEKSDDGGQTWTVQWQLHYQRKRNNP